MRLARLLVTFVLAAGMLAVAPSSAGACGCSSADDERTPSQVDAERAAAAEAIFVGEAEVVPQPWITPPDDHVAITFRVHEVFAGEVQLEQPVLDSSSSCSLDPVQEGETYLVYAQDGGSVLFPDVSDGTLTTQQCSGTRLLAEGPVPAALGVGSPPGPGTLPEPQRLPGEVSEVGWLLLGLSPLLLLGVVLLVGRRWPGQPAEA